MSFIERAKNLFAKPSATGVVSDGTVSNSPVSLFNEQAIDNIISVSSRMPDVDKVLQKAGLNRRHLETLMYDDEIYQAIETRRDALLSTPLRIEAGDDPNGLIIEEEIRNVKQPAIFGAFGARLYGHSIIESVYKKRDDGKIGYSFLGEKPFEWFEPKSDGRLIMFPQSGSYLNNSASGVEVDQRYKFFLTRNNPTYKNPYGDALLSRLYWIWFMRFNGWNFWAKALERFGTPLLVGKSADPKLMVEALLQAHNNAVIGIDTDDEVAAVGVSGSTMGSAFESFDNALVRRTQKIVLGQTLTSGTDGGSGNRALGQVHDAVRMDKRNSDIKLITPTLQRMVDALCELNGFKPMQVVFGDEQGLEKDRAVRDKDLYAVGVRFDKGYFKDNYDLRDEDFQLTSEALGVGNSPTAPARGDAQTSPTGSASAKASKITSSLFAKPDAKFTPAQQIIENLADGGLNDAGGPISPDKLRSAILLAIDPDDLANRLFALLGQDVSEKQFQKMLEQSLYAADVIGYVSADKGEQ
jgi:phage gp29-like protein